MSKPADPKPTAWDICRTEGEGGTGNWRALRRTPDELKRAADDWRQQIGDVRKAWLCWNMNDAWCLLQQRLILEAGWTPVVGWDPNSNPGGPGKLASGAVAIDFNHRLRLPVLFPHVPMELAHLWTDRLAFWHADMLLTRPKMKAVTSLFEDLGDGEIAAVFSFGGLRTLFQRREHRYWEVLGCVTQAASADMFQAGCGWWRHWARNHVNAPSDTSLRERRSGYCWDHGGGVLYWKQHHGGNVRRISERFIKDGHFSVTSKKNYIRASSKSEEMDLNFDLKEISSRFGFADLIV